MFGDGALTFREFGMREQVPLADIHRSVLEFLQGLTDVALFGAQAVNAYVDEPRMTQDIDVMSPRAERLAAELIEHLGSRHHIAVRVREVADGRGYRVYQVAKPKNRHLVDIRSVASLPPTQSVSGLLVVIPAELIAEKVIAFQSRRGKPKAGTDWRDIAMMLLQFPEMKSSRGLVRDRLDAAGANEDVIGAWEDIVKEEILASDEDDEFE